MSDGRHGEREDARKAAKRDDGLCARDAPAATTAFKSAAKTR